jgi:hypothetical protein
VRCRSASRSVIVTSALLVILFVVVAFLADNETVVITAALAQVVCGKRQEPVCALSQAVVVGFIELVLHDANRNGRGANPQHRHAGGETERETEGKRWAPLHAFTW